MTRTNASIKKEGKEMRMKKEKKMLIISAMKKKKIADMMKTSFSIKYDEVLI